MQRTRHLSHPDIGEPELESFLKPVERWLRLVSPETPPPRLSDGFRAHLDDERFWHPLFDLGDRISKHFRTEMPVPDSVRYRGRISVRTLLLSIGFISDTRPMGPRKLFGERVSAQLLKLLYATSETGLDGLYDIRSNFSWNPPTLKIVLSLLVSELRRSAEFSPKQTEQWFVTASRVVPRLSLAERARARREILAIVNERLDSASLPLAREALALLD